MGAGTKIMVGVGVVGAGALAAYLLLRKKHPDGLDTTTPATTPGTGPKANDFPPGDVDPLPPRPDTTIFDNATRRILIGIHGVYDGDGGIVHLTPGSILLTGGAGGAQASIQIARMNTTDTNRPNGIASVVSPMSANFSPPIDTIPLNVQLGTTDMVVEYDLANPGGQGSTRHTVRYTLSVEPGPFPML